MFQYLISLFLNFWLVIATLLFIVIVFTVFRPSARKRMEDHALIPFDEEEGRP
ncbi:cbb3-type cytochrome oxidase subunit 3 [Brucella intermedia]|uniref:cbb3-type cytochrome oxidase subunit 3 n=1 Tax=Brucella intermedia TaxID=94625 RepID=UPI00224AC74E|nr:cbb3-type cytochrome c oxidase subunit 3 [Brucella intermedia]